MSLEERKEIEDLDDDDPTAAAEGLANELAGLFDGEGLPIWSHGCPPI